MSIFDSLKGMLGLGGGQSNVSGTPQSSATDGLLGSLASKFNLDNMNKGELLNKIKTGSANLGREATRMALQLYYVLRADTTPKMDKALIGFCLAYQFMPNLLDREKVGPILALADNALALVVVYKKMKKNVTPEVEQQADEQLTKWFGPKTTVEPQVVTATETTETPEAPAQE